ncbi:MAG: chemotaxis protein CheB, partial [Verrucomicrobiota bacterium]
MKARSRSRRNSASSPDRRAVRVRGKAASPRLVVGVGASAGGLEALARFFKPIPTPCGVAFVVIQHLSPDFRSLMDQLLARHTEMRVILVKGRTRLAADTVYLLPPGKEMVCEGRFLAVRERSSNKSLMPINLFLNSLAREFRERAAGVILSGTGSDGTQGLIAVHEAGGLALVQDEDSARFNGMPRSAVESGAADAVLPPGDMAQVLVEYAKNPGAALKPPAQGRVSGLEEGLPGLLERLREVYGIDFKGYKPATIFRRVHRRVSLQHRGSLAEYARSALEDPRELAAVYRDLLIGVTRFFRDPEAFAELKRRVIEPLVAATSPQDELRAWVAGCATGEEAYTVAMLFADAFQERGREPNVKIFATDVHRESLQFASDGLYSEAALDSLPSDHYRQFFHMEGGRVRVSSRLRRLLLFSPHNVMKDPPLTRMDLVSCRNLLIYLRPAVQARVLGSFHFALRTGGVLFLGPSETPGGLAAEFGAVEARCRLFRKVRDVRAHRGAAPGAALVPPETGAGALAPMADARLARAYESLVGTLLPPGILVNERREVLHVFGEASAFLSPPTGRMSSDVTRLTRGDLRLALSSAIHAVVKRGQRVEHAGVRCQRDGRGVVVDVIADPVPDRPTDSLFVFVQFRERGGSPKALERAGRVRLKDAARTRLESLESELAQTRQSLQSANEELETNNEELQASNEEMLASNEELQSTNEELHSVNEELCTVNAEYEKKIRELALAQQELKDQKAALDEHAIVAVTDPQGRITYVNDKFCAISGYSREELLGRDHRLVNSGVHPKSFFAQLWNTILSGQVWKGEVCNRSKDGRLFWEDTTIVPFRGADGKPSQFVAIRADITQRRQAEAAVRESLSEKETLLKEIHHRVKNNMQLISSLLNLQGECIQDPEARQAFEQAQHRIRSMALIHERFYRSSSLAQIEFSE